MKSVAAKNAGNAETKTSKLFVIFVFLVIFGFYAVKRLAVLKRFLRRVTALMHRR
jgi:hypothetical protein